jgi:2-haloacid dehalogenase
MAAPAVDLLQFPPRALTFDVFGTVVDWRKTVNSLLTTSALAKTSSSSQSSNLSPEVRSRLARLTQDSWGEFAQQWRNSYKSFVKGYKPDEDPWMDIDTHHRLSLMRLLKDWDLEGLYDDHEIEDLSKVWHHLEPWPETSLGLKMLSDRFITSTLSNGNQSLLNDLNEHGDLNFQLLQSSEDFKAYKPHPSVYLGACKKMDLKPGEVAMVAAHLVDLKAAKGNGMRTIYVERKGEEDWDPKSDEYQKARAWVDMWISESENGFVEVARRFGL